jgi:hypothetical protein
MVSGETALRSRSVSKRREVPPRCGNFSQGETLRERGGFPSPGRRLREPQATALAQAVARDERHPKGQ